MNAVDTNVFVYFFDREEPTKQTQATQLLDRLVQRPTETVLLWQVAAELLSCLRRWEATGKRSSADVDSDIHDVLAMFPLVKCVLSAGVREVGAVVGIDWRSILHWRSTDEREDEGTGRGGGRGTGDLGDGPPTAAQRRASWTRDRTIRAVRRVEGTGGAGVRRAGADAVGAVRGMSGRGGRAVRAEASHPAHRRRAWFENRHPSNMTLFLVETCSPCMGVDLELVWNVTDNHVYMTGPAAEVFQGEWLGGHPRAESDRR